MSEGLSGPAALRQDRVSRLFVEGHVEVVEKEGEVTCKGEEDDAWP